MAHIEEQELDENLREQADYVLNSLSSESCKLSVLVTGGSQNGKSSMIKNIFGQAVEGSGEEKIIIGLNRKPVTQNVTLYLDEKNKFELIDTPGLEKNLTNDCISQIQKELEEKKIQPSIVWVVLNYQASIEDVELKLAELVPDVPVIFIVNKCDFLQKKQKEIQDNPQSLEHFDELPEDELSEWMKKSSKLMAIRRRLLQWKDAHKHVHRIVITSLESGDDDDEVPIGLETVLAATWGCLDTVGRVLLAELQKNSKINKIKGAVAIVLATVASAAGVARIRMPVVDSIFISSIQTTMVISLYKYWDVTGIDAKTFAMVFLKRLAPVLVRFAADYSIANVVKLFFGLGSLIGGTLDWSIVSIGTIVIGVLVIAYLSQYVYRRHQDTSKAELEKNIQDFIKSPRFEKILSDLKTLEKNPTQITSNTLVDILQR